MSQRINYIQQSPELFKRFVAFSMAAHEGSIEKSVSELIALRASQMNGCGFCVDMHVKQATIHGERALRLHHVAIWRESALFSARERAALAWTEVLTKLPEHGVPDDVYESVRAQFTEQELSELTFKIVEINGWNRLNVAFRTEPGSSDKAFGLEKANLA